MSDSPWLSVLIPTYNGEAYLAATLDSIVAQADSDIECIVVDDGSADRTLAILDSYKTRLQLTVECSPHTGNWVKNTNRALSVARGEYACFLHQDDIWLDGRLKTLKGLAHAYPEISLLLNACIFIDHIGRNLGHWRCPLPALPRHPDRDMVLARLLVQNFVPIPGPIFRRDLAVEVGGMDGAAWYTADWDFWLRLAETGPTGYYPHPMAGFRIHPASQTIVRSAMQEDFRSQHEIVARKHLALWNPPSSMREKVRRLSEFSIEANTALAAYTHGQKTNLIRLLLQLLQLGPRQVHNYLRDSRIWERASARIRARL